jgi:hypothetical protein
VSVVLPEDGPLRAETCGSGSDSANKVVLITNVCISRMGGVCSAYGGEEMCVQGFGGET